VERVASRARVVPLTRDATLVLLAGGRSVRMGRDKATLPVAGGTLVEWIARRLGPAFAETIVCGAHVSGARVVADRHPGAGPLAGMEAGLLAMRTERAFVLACDMPRASAALASLLLDRLGRHDAAVPRVGGVDQPACAAYGRGAASRITAFLDGGGRRVSACLATLDVLSVGEGELVEAGIAPDEVADLDTPADYEAFVASLRAPRD